MPHFFSISEVPKQWEIIAKFASKGNEGTTLYSQQVEIIADNSMFMDDQAHVGDESPLQQLVHMPFGEQECLGIVLVSQLSICVKCSGNFSILTVQVTYFYTLNLPAVQYSKYCSRKKCSL